MKFAMGIWFTKGAVQSTWRAHLLTSMHAGAMFIHFTILTIFWYHCTLAQCTLYTGTMYIVHRHNVHCTPAQCTLSIVIFSSVQKTNLCTKKSILEIPVCSLRYFCILSSHSQNKLKENFTKWKKNRKCAEGKGVRQTITDYDGFFAEGGGRRAPPSPKIEKIKNTSF